MAKLTIISNGISSADIHTAINANFTFLNALISGAASLVTINNTMQGQTLLNNINGNFTELNAHIAVPASLSTITIGITGAILNSLFISLNNAIGRGSTTRGYFLEYYFSALHYCTTRRDKILAFDGVDTLSLSLDNGVTFPYSKQIEGMEDMITFAYIYLNGNIVFCTETKAYYSMDNLTTINEATILGIDGLPFSPYAHNNFGCISYGNYNPLDMAVWGAYSIESSTGNVNCWYSLDGTVIKSWYKIGSPGITSDHIHAVNYCPIDGSFWIQTGDGVNKCAWIKGIYNSVNDTWTTSVIKQGGSDSQFKTGGMIFSGEYIYWFNDGGAADSILQGVWRCKYVDILDETKYEQTFVWTDDLWGGAGDGNEFIVDDIVHLGGLNPLVSIDGVNFYHSSLTNDLALVNVSFLGSLTPKNNQGFYRGDLIISADGAFTYLYKGAILMLKVNH